jgi:hypothetical protein
VEEGRVALDHARWLLKTNDLGLKGTGGVYDLGARDRASLLGYAIRKTGKETAFELGDTTLVRIRQLLAKAHETPRPAESARMALSGWASSVGPAINSAGAMLPEIRTLTVAYGLREAFLPRDLQQTWQHSHRRWLKALNAASLSYNGDNRAS